MTTAAAQLWFILRNDLRVGLRSLWRRKWSLTVLLLIAGVGQVVLHGLALLLFGTLDAPPAERLETVAWAFFAFLMLGSAMQQAISLLFERSDFDLLLSSPVSPRIVLLARMLTISGSAGLGAAFFLVPLLNAAMVQLPSSYAAGYLVWLLLALLCAAAGTLVTLALVRSLGARRARTLVQVLGAFVGAGIYLTVQLPHFMGDRARPLLEWLSTPLAFPAVHTVTRATHGSLTDLAWLLVTTATVVTLCARGLARTFLTGVQESTEHRSRRAPRGTLRLRDGVFRATYRKDLRLIARDSLLLSQVLPTLMYVLPAVFGVRALGGWAILAPLGLLMAVQFSSLLTTVAVAGEEGLDLIRSSPISELRLRWAKIAAAMTVPVSVGFVLFVIVAATGRPWLAGLALVFALLNAAACSWLKASDAAPGRRADLLRTARSRLTLKSVLGGFVMGAALAGIGVLAGGGNALVATLFLGLNALAVLACFVFVEAKPLAE